MFQASKEYMFTDTIEYDTQEGVITFCIGSIINAPAANFFECSQGKYKMMSQTGGVLIKANCHIGAGAIIERGTIDYTTLCKGVLVGTKALIGHDCIIGTNTRIGSCAKISGYTLIGNNVIIGSNASIVDHITIGHNSIIMAGANVTKSVPDNSVIGGYWGDDWTESKKREAWFRLKYKKESRCKNAKNREE